MFNNNKCIYHTDFLLLAVFFFSHFCNILLACLGAKFIALQQTRLWSIFCFAELHFAVNPRAGSTFVVL